MNILYLRKKSVNPPGPRSSKRALVVPRHSDGHEVVYGGAEGVDVELDDGAS